MKILNVLPVLMRAPFDRGRYVILVMLMLILTGWAKSQSNVSKYILFRAPEAQNEVVVLLFDEPHAAHINAYLHLKNPTVLKVETIRDDQWYRISVENQEAESKNLWVHLGKGPAVAELYNFPPILIRHPRSRSNAVRLLPNKEDLAGEDSSGFGADLLQGTFSLADYFSVMDAHLIVKKDGLYPKAEIYYRLMAGSRSILPPATGWVSGKEIDDFYVPLSNVADTESKLNEPEWQWEVSFRDLDAIVSDIGDRVGACLLSKKQKKALPKTAKLRRRPLPAPQLDRGANVVDQIFSPHWENYLREAYSRREDFIWVAKNRVLMGADLAAIDLLARTVFAEVTSTCYQNSLPSMAVGAVVRNRVEEVQNGNYSFFTREKPNSIGSSVWSDWMGVISRKEQFSCWNRQHPGGQQNESLPQVLCPPSNPDQVYYAGSRPSESEHGVWEMALRTAIAAYLNHPDFESVHDHIPYLYYTNGTIEQFYDYDAVSPVTIGNESTPWACVKFWSPRHIISKVYKSKKLAAQ